MGKSPTIEQMAAKEDAYRGYLNKLKSELAASAKTDTDALEGYIDAFYKKNNWDNVRWITGTNYDYMQKAEWSLANVKTIIDAIGKVVFGDTTGKLPDGVKAESDKDIGAALAAMGNEELYIASKVFDVLSGIVMSFGNSSSVSFSHVTKDEPIGNGFHLFAVVASDAYASHDFFNNEEIIEYLYAYEIRFSHKEADLEASTTLTKLYEDQITTFSLKVEQLLDQLTNGTITPEQYQSQTTIYNTLIEAAKVKLKELGGQ